MDITELYAQYGEAMVKQEVLSGQIQAIKQQLAQALNAKDNKKAPNGTSKV